MSALKQFHSRRSILFPPFLPQRDKVLKMAHLNRRAKVMTAMLATAALFVTACGSSDDTSDAAGDGAGTGTIISGVAYATTNYHPSSTSSALRSEEHTSELQS